MQVPTGLKLVLIVCLWFAAVVGTVGVAWASYSSVPSQSPHPPTHSLYVAEEEEAARCAEEREKAAEEALLALSEDEFEALPTDVKERVEQMRHQLKKERLKKCVRLTGPWAGKMGRPCYLLSQLVC